MEQRKRLKIDLDELCYALDNSSYEQDYYLDLETGEILMISDYMDTRETEELREQPEEDPERYEPLPKADSREGYRDMEDFIATVEDEHLAELLEVAINAKRAFRRFKDVLAGFPEEWFRFKDGRLMERALEWLEDVGVEPV